MTRVLLKCEYILRV